MPGALGKYYIFLKITFTDEVGLATRASLASGAYAVRNLLG